MFHPLTTELPKIGYQWFARTLRAVGLCLLIGMLVGSGPWACFVHCVIAGQTHAAHDSRASHHVPAVRAADDHGRVVSTSERGDHALCDDLMGQSSELLPSALTIGVVLAISLIPQMFAIGLRRLDLAPRLRLLSLPPPRDPPRIANSFG
ncbi:MAG TPA: hypothetical protein VFZ66_23905 [Herpetosiphonaceae bacterium]